MSAALDLDIPDLAIAEIARREAEMRHAEEAEEDLLAFIRMFWRSVEPEAQFISGWPLEALCDLLMSVSDGEITRAIANLFPGAMKSLTLNVFFPAWEWGPRRMAHLRYISISYTSINTERDNQRLLRILADPVYQRCWPHVKVTRDTFAIVENSATGWKRAAGASGSITGQRANRILLDDINNPFDVESDTVRAQTNLFLREVMPDRLNSLERDAIVNVQHRVHEEDATGTLAQYGKNYAWMCIPMRFDPLRPSTVVLKRAGEADVEEAAARGEFLEIGAPIDVWTDPRGLDANGNELAGLYTDDRGNLAIEMGSPMAKAEGKLAWPARFSEDVVDEQERIKGPYAFSAQYQQSPTVRGGAIIRRDWWQPWLAPDFPDLGTVVAALDTGIEEGRNNDPSALITMGAFAGPGGEPKLILTSAWRQKSHLAELVARVAESCFRAKVDYLVIERATRGKDVHDEIVRLYADAPWQTVLVVPTKSKVERLKSVAHLFSGDCRRHPVPGGKPDEYVDVYSGGMIHAPMKDWADEVITETAAFPNGAHDEFPDCVSLLLGWVRRNGVALRRVEWQAMEDDERRYRPPVTVPYAIARG